jgi:hypothetical protein
LYREEREGRKKEGKEGDFSLQPAAVNAMRNRFLAAGRRAMTDEEIMRWKVAESSHKRMGRVHTFLRN